METNIVQCMICEKRFATIMEHVNHMEKMERATLTGKNKMERCHIINKISLLVLAWDDSNHKANALGEFINGTADLLAYARETRKQGWNDYTRMMVTHLRAPHTWTREDTANGMGNYARWFIVQHMVYLNYQV